MKKRNFKFFAGVALATITLASCGAKKPTYNVTFEGIETPVVVTEGNTVTAPTAPTKEGYTFDGWDFDFTTAITGDVTISAKWVKNGPAAPTKAVNEAWLATKVEENTNTDRKDKGNVVDGELGTFFSIIAGETAPQYRKTGAYLAIHFAKANEGGIKFTSVDTADLTVKLASTGGSNVSLFKLVDAQGNVYLPDGYAELTDTAADSTAAKVDDVVTAIYGTKGTEITFSNLGAGTYSMFYVSGTYKGTEIESGRGGRFMSITLKNALAA